MRDCFRILPYKKIYNGDAAVDKENPLEYFGENKSDGFDAIICINNEKPLIPF
jgi:hypothetical protein